VAKSVAKVKIFSNQYIFVAKKETFGNQYILVTTNYIQYF